MSFQFILAMLADERKAAISSAVCAIVLAPARRSASAS
jgi:hypothetical protein